MGLTQTGLSDAQIRYCGGAGPPFDRFAGAISGFPRRSFAGSKLQLKVPPGPGQREASYCRRESKSPKLLKLVNVSVSLSVTSPFLIFLTDLGIRARTQKRPRVPVERVCVGNVLEGNGNGKWCRNLLIWICRAEPTTHSENGSWIHSTGE